MNRRIETLLSSLREAIHEAIADSNAVAELMAELDREGHAPSFLIEVGLPEDALTAKERAEMEAGERREIATLDRVTPHGPLFLTESDEDFLRNLGVAMPSCFEYGASSER
jgi:hypothetical protein